MTELINLVKQVVLSDSSDQPVWMLNSSSKYSVKSFYKMINFGGVSSDVKDDIWKIKVPLRIKIFMWFVHKQVILTKDNLLRRSWVGNSLCCFYDNDETIQHLFIDCPLAKLLWHTIHIAFNISPPVSIDMLFGT